ncbi:MAG: hydrogenase maturation protease, partial [Candidatus Marinimicrobia bacterium]|nr:hydrogenase maturation protease [Candidatus Neomarinimicrobiota bacterium]
MTKDKKLKVIAVGNDLYGDDGVGNAVLNVLEQIPEMREVELINGATDALGLIDHFSGVDHVIIVDAAQMGEKPGTVKVFSKEEVKLKIKMDHLSVHGISLAETFDIAQAVDSLPGEITIIGIEPKNIGISQNLSDVVTQSISEVVSNII